jgi:hypothetical protein
MMLLLGGRGDYVQLIEFGTVVIFFVNLYVKSFFVNGRAFQSHALIPVQLANKSF